jgi:hypothetical protein
LAGYYRRFIKEFSNIASPMTQLTRKGVKFDWTRECGESFWELKKRLISASMLALPKGLKGFVVYSDASIKDWGAY